MRFFSATQNLSISSCLLLIAGACAVPTTQADSLVDKVNPMIGASTSMQYGEGKTFPGAATPFGLVQLSPDTITKCPPEGGGWGNGDGKADYTVYFYAQFNKPITKCGVWSAEIPAGWRRKREDIESRRYRKVVAAARILEGCREQEGDRQPPPTNDATYRSNYKVVNLP